MPPPHLHSNTDSSVCSLSTYEENLRDLGMRKKLKAGDWKRIYYFARSQGLEDAKYEILLNGSPIEWTKAWKEMRRSGATRSTPPSKSSLRCEAVTHHS